MTYTDVPARSVDELTKLIEATGAVKYLFFWGHQPLPGGGIGSGCLSQWWPATFTVDGEEYPTAEHFMMVGKARLFDHEDIAQKILSSPRPGAAKALGRQVSGFDQQVWNDHCYDIVLRGNLAKFSQHPELNAFLLGTAGRVLVEASPVDPVWGIGLAANDPRATDPRQWPGRNLLGFVLMEARATLADPG